MEVLYTIFSYFLIGCIFAAPTLGAISSKSDGGIWRGIQSIISSLVVLAIAVIVLGFLDTSEVWYVGLVVLVCLASFFHTKGDADDDGHLARTEEPEEGDAAVIKGQIFEKSLGFRGERIGEITEDGLMFDSNALFGKGDYKGRITKDGYIFDENEKNRGRLKEDGYIFDENGKNRGRLTEDGFLRNETGAVIGELVD